MNKIDNLQFLFEQRMYLENILYDFVPKEILHKAMKKVNKRIKDELEAKEDE